MILVRLWYVLVSISFAFAFLAAPVLSNGAAAPSVDGQTITRIEFPSDQPLEQSELRQMLESQGIAQGRQLREEAVRNAIQRLFRTGRFADIQVNAEPASGGVVLQFVTKNAWFIGHVGIEGKIAQPPNRGQLVNATRLELGTPFQAADVATAEDGIRKLLTANGYYEAKVAHRLDYLDVAQEVNVIFTVDPGKRARYTEPQINGTDLVLSVKKIIKSTGWHHFLIPGWRSVTQRRTNQGVQNVRVRYDKSGRLFASVQLSSLDYDAAKRKVKPNLDIAAGPKVDIKTVGYKIRKGKLRNNVPIYEEHTVDRDLLQEGANNLRDELQADGYFDAQVEYQQPKPVGGKQEILFVITPGVRHKLVSLVIEGNRYFTTKTIRERMFIEPSSFQFRHGRYSNAFLKRDKESITNLYRANGFRDVNVVTKEDDDYQGKTGNMAVTMRVEEGRQWIVSRLDVEGYSKLDLHRIMATLNSSDDQPFSEFNIAADREQILNYYFENGFPNAQFNWTSTPGPKPTTMNLKYTIVEGEQQFVRQVVYSGIKTTKPRLVDRQILLSPGDPLSPVAMGETQRRLYDLGIFAKVDNAIENPDGDTTQKYVLYDMEEASKYSVTGGFGAEIARIGGSNTQNDLSSPGGATGFSPRVSLDVTRINFMGIGHTLAFRSRYSTLQKRAQINYLFPRFLSNPALDLTFTTFYDNSYDVRTFAARRLEGSVQLTQHISKSLTAFYRIAYRQVNVSNLKIDPLLAPLLSETTRTGIISANLIQDRRDDPTDAHRGIYNSIDVGIAGRFFGGRNDFFRVLGRNATYHRIGEKMVLARQVSVGLIPAFGSKPNTTDPDSIPLAERFFGGGTDSMRGFPQNQAGPRDFQTGFPLGGSALFFNNTELRFPLLGDNIGGVLFEDFGNVFATPGDISFRFSQPKTVSSTGETDYDFNYMVHAAGFGIRYRTPIGPVRLDLAYSINPPRYNGFKGSFQDLLNCTAAGTCERAPQQISHFQFFFSIGQTF
jgi:outer membrane protein assembly complex protein YaeT